MQPDTPIRAAELDILAAAAARASTGTPVAVALIGSPGVGKSWLIDNFLHTIESESVVLRIDPRVGHGVRPLAPLLEMVSESWDTLEAAGAGRVGAELAAAVRRGTKAREIWRLLDAVCAVLAASAPVVVTIDPVADHNQPLLDALAHVIRRSSGRCLLILLAARSEVPVDDFIVTTDTPILPVEPLSQAESLALLRTLAGESIHQDRLEALSVKAKGNPHFLIELAAATTDEGASAPAATLRSLLQRRITRLSDPARTLLRTAGLAIPPAGLRFCALAAGLDPDDRAPLDECEEAALLDSDGGDTLEFPTPVVRELAVAGTSQAERRRLHGNIANLLILLEAPGPQAAYHACAAAVPGDKLAGTAIELATEAADAAVATGTPRAALRLADAALALAPDTADEARLLTARAEALLHLGNNAAAVAAFEEALGHHPTPRGQLGLGRALQRAGRPEAALEVFERASGPGAGPSASRGRSEVLLALGRVHEAESTAHAAVREARAIGDPAVLASALADTALAEAVLLRPGAVQTATEAVKLWQEAGEDALDWPPLFVLGVALEAADGFAESLEVLREQRRWLDVRGMLDMVPRTVRTETTSAFHSCSWGAMEEAIAAAVDVRRHRPNHEMGPIRAAGAALGALRGDDNAFAKGLAAGRAALRRQATPFDLALLDWWEGMGRVVHGELGVGISHLASAADRFREIDAVGFLTRSLLTLTVLHAALGDTEAARYRARDFARARKDGLRASDGDALVVKAATAGRLGAPELVRAARAYGEGEHRLAALVAVAAAGCLDEHLGTRSIPSDLRDVCLGLLAPLGADGPLADMLKSSGTSPIRNGTRPR